MSNETLLGLTPLLDEREQLKQAIGEAEKELKAARLAPPGYGSLRTMPSWINLICLPEDRIATSYTPPHLQRMADEIAAANNFVIEPAASGDGYRLVYPFVVWIHIDLPNSNHIDPKRVKFDPHYMPVLIHELGWNKNGTGLWKTPHSRDSRTPHKVQTYGYQLFFNRPDLDISLRSVGAACAMSTCSYNNQLQSFNWKVLLPTKYRSLLKPDETSSFIDFFDFLKRINPSFTKQTLRESLQQNDIPFFLPRPEILELDKPPKAPKYQSRAKKTKQVIQVPALTDKAELVPINVEIGQFSAANLLVLDPFEFRLPDQ